MNFWGGRKKEPNLFTTGSGKLMQSIGCHQPELAGYRCSEGSTWVLPCVAYVTIMLQSASFGLCCTGRPEMFLLQREM